MPLIHSKSNKARQENIERELSAHPEMNPKQAVAIGYSVQRKARKHDAQGNRVEHEKRKYGR